MDLIDSSELVNHGSDRDGVIEDELQKGPIDDELLKGPTDDKLSKELMLQKINDYLYINNYDQIEPSSMSDETVRRIYKFVMEGVIPDDISSIEASFIGNYYLMQEDFPLAMIYYKIEDTMGRKYAKYHIARCYGKMEDYDNMVKYYILSIEENNIEYSLRDLFNYFTKIGDYKNALKWVKIAIRRQIPSAMKLLGFLAKTNQSIFEKMCLDDAIEEYDNAEAIHRLANIYANEGKYDQAIDLYKKISNDYCVAMVDLAFLYKKTKQYDEMLECFNTLHQKRHIESTYQLGLFYYEKGEYGKAYPYLELASGKGHSKALCTMADYHEKICDGENMMKYASMSVKKNQCFSCKRLISRHFFDSFGHISDELIMEIIPLLSMDDISKLKRSFDSCKKLANFNLDELCGLEECPICMVEKHMITTKCNHKICFSCYKKISKCPMCRQRIKN